MPSLIVCQEQHRPWPDGARGVQRSYLGAGMGLAPLTRSPATEPTWAAVSTYGRRAG